MWGSWKESARAHGLGAQLSLWPVSSADLAKSSPFPLLNHSCLPYPLMKHRVLFLSFYREVNRGNKREVSGLGL